MRMAYKQILVSLLFLVPVSAWAALPSENNCAGGDLFSSMLGPIGLEAEKAGSVTCKGAPSTCVSKCRAPVEKWKKQVSELTKTAGASDKSIACAGAGITGMAAGTAVNNERAQNAGSDATMAGKQSNEARAKNAQGAKAKFEQCRKEIQDGCEPLFKGLGTEDKKAISAVVKACESGAKGTAQFADQKKQDGMGMGDLSKMMDLASKAMGMAQQAQQQQQPSSAAEPEAATSPTPASESAAAEIAVNKFSSGNSTAAPTVGFGAVPEVAKTTGGPGGVSSSGLSGSSTSPPEGFGSAGGVEGGAAVEAGAPAGSSGGGIGGGSSGSSRAGEASAAAAESNANNYEMSPGGGGRSGMVGLKASKSDLDDIASGSALDTGANPEEMGARDPASEESAGIGESPMDEADSIFSRIRSKYGSLKGAGRI